MATITDSPTQPSPINYTRAYRHDGLRYLRLQVQSHLTGAQRERAEASIMRTFDALWR